MSAIKNQIIAGLYGLREAILEVADKVQFVTQITKIKLELYDLKRNLRKNQTLLGRTFYQYNKDSDNLAGEMEQRELRKYLNVCRDLTDRISRQQQRLQILSASLPDESWEDFKKILGQKRFKVAVVTLPRDSSLKGNMLKDTKLPHDLLVLGILKKRNRWIIAKGDVRLDMEDKIFLLGPESSVETYAQVLGQKDRQASD